MNNYWWSNEDKHLLVNWINDNRYYFFDNYFDSIVRFRTCIEQTQFSKPFTISDVEYAWNQLRNEGENMGIEYQKQLEGPNCMRRMFGVLPGPERGAPAEVGQSGSLVATSGSGQHGTVRGPANQGV